MLNHTLEKRLKEERSSREMLQQQLKSVTIDVNKLSQEKSEMLQVLSHKVSVFKRIFVNKHLTRSFIVFLISVWHTELYFTAHV